MFQKAVVLGICAMALSWAAVQAQENPQPTEEVAVTDTILTANKALVEGLMSALSTGDLAALDNLVAEAYIQNGAGRPSTREGLRATFTAYRAAFPDITWTIDQMVAEGDYVFVYTTITGTQEGTFNGIPPTGRSVTIHTADLYRVESGLLAEHWDVIDQLGMMQQLGVIPTPS